MKKRLLLVKPSAVTADDIKRAEQLCGIVIVPCAFLETVKSVGESDLHTDAVMDVWHRIMGSNSVDFNRGVLTKWYAEFMLKNA